MIQKIKASNFKILEFVDINPKKGVQFIFGPNGSGKSTMLDIVETAIVGGKKILDPIRDGQKKSELEIQIDDYSIKKVFTASGSTLKIFKDGVKQAGGLKLIETLINKIGFDPHAFSRKNAKEQRLMLMELLGIDFTKFDEQRAEIFTERTEIGSQAKMLPKYTVEDIEFYKKHKDMDGIDLSELSEEIQEEHKNHQAYETRIDGIKTNEDTIKEYKIELERIKVKIQALKHQSNDLRRIKCPKSNLNELKDKFNNAEETNENIRKALEIDKNVILATDLGKRYSAKTEDINAIDTHKVNVLKNAKMPLEGLSITDDCVTFNDRAFEQLSTSEKMKVSIVISLLLMDDKKEKIIMIREGNLLDDKSIEVVKEMAKKNDCYFFIEMVLDENSETPKEGILIQEGKIKAIDGKKISK